MVRIFGLLIVMGLAAAGSTTASVAQQSQPQVSIVQKWLGSGHADAQSPSFTHWDGEASIPGTCATCHSGEGFRDFYGIDGSAVGAVDHPITPGGVIDCDTCHNDAIADIEGVTFPSGIVVQEAGSNATCMTCHQGRQSGNAVATATADADADAVNAEITFINPHYASAAATLLGSAVGGGYEYPDRNYVGRFEHVPALAQCADCHDPHGLGVRVETCAGCHGSENPRSIRTSQADFDGDGDIGSGMHDEVAALADVLLEAIKTYSLEVTAAPIDYTVHFPYFVAQNTNTAGSPYRSWTPRLLRAAYNYQFVTKDKGAYAHNPHYAVQLLHDSISDLGQALGTRFEIGARP